VLKFQAAVNLTRLVVYISMPKLSWWW